MGNLTEIAETSKLPVGVHIACQSPSSLLFLYQFQSDKRISNPPQNIQSFIDMFQNLSRLRVPRRMCVLPHQDNSGRESSVSPTPVLRHTQYVQHGHTIQLHLRSVLWLHTVSVLEEKKWELSPVLRIKVLPFLSVDPSIDHKFC